MKILIVVMDKKQNSLCVQQIIYVEDRKSVV